MLRRRKERKKAKSESKKSVIYDGFYFFFFHFEIFYFLEFFFSLEKKKKGKDLVAFPQIKIVPIISDRLQMGRRVNPARRVSAKGTVNRRADRVK